MPDVRRWIRDSIWLLRLFQQPCFFKVDGGRERICAEITKIFREVIQCRTLFYFIFKVYLTPDLTPPCTSFHLLLKTPQWWPPHLLPGSKGCWNTFWKADWCAGNHWAGVTAEVTPLQDEHAASAGWQVTLGSFHRVGMFRVMTICGIVV